MCACVCVRDNRHPQQQHQRGNNARSMEQALGPYSFAPRPRKSFYSWFSFSFVHAHPPPHPSHPHHIHHHLRHAKRHVRKACGGVGWGNGIPRQVPKCLAHKQRPSPKERVPAQTRTRADACPPVFPPTCGPYAFFAKGAWLVFFVVVLRVCLLFPSHGLPCVPAASPPTSPPPLFLSHNEKRCVPRPRANLSFLGVPQPMCPLPPFPFPSRLQ